MPENLTYNIEINRKKLHLLSFFIPIIYILNSKYILFFSITVSFLVVLIDILRLFNIYQIKTLESVLRAYEKNKPMTATYLILVFTFIILFFDKNIAIYALLVGSICDAAACLFWRKYGKIKIFKDKTLEGTLAFNITGVFVIFLFYFIIDRDMLIIYPFLSLFISSIAEHLTDGRYDNITTPLSFALFMKFVS